MPDDPQAALAAAERALIVAAADFGTDVIAGTPPVLARAALDAAAPLLAESVAEKILAHAERQHPRDHAHVPTAWDRHFSIAARVAAGAFTTREESLRMAAEAIARGDYVACPAPEGEQ